MRVGIFLLAGFIAVVAEPISDGPGRIVGGSIPHISQYPFTAALGRDEGWTVVQACGGSIINNRSILTAAICMMNTVASQWRIRVGSIYARSGGIVHNATQIISHPLFNVSTGINNIAILRTVTTIAFVAGTVEPASIAGPNYMLIDNQPVWAIGWGEVIVGGPWSEQMRHVQLWTINQATCRERVTFNYNVTDSMLCAGWLELDGRGQCSGDNGSPLLHNGVVVGVFFAGFQCGLSQWPGINTRVSHYTGWILGNA